MWKLEASDRLSRWRAFRITLSSRSLSDAITDTAEMWQNCPHKPYYLDPADPAAWPNAWDLLTENYYCDIAKALGMLYTIAFSNHGHDLPMELRTYIDEETGYDYNLAVFCQGKYVINFLDSQSVNIQQIEKKFKLKRCYTSDILKLQ